MKRVILISILIFFMLAPMNAQAQVPIPVAVEIECQQSTIDINVHPEENQPVSVSCTVENTGSFKEQIDIDWNVEGNDFNLDVSGDTSWDIEAGDSESFTAVFTASARIEVKSEEFTIIATVVTVTLGSDPINVPVGFANATSEIGGTVNSLAYSRVDLEVSNPTTRNIEVSEEESIQFTIFNDGNRVDNLEVIVVNQQEIEDAGFKFISDSFYRATVDPGSSSEQGTILLEAPSETSSEITIQVELRAYSKLDESAEPSVITVRVVVAASGGGGALGDFDTMSSENWAMIGMAGGGLIGVILLLVIISRLTKKTAGKQKVAQKEAKKAAKAERKSGRKGKKAKPVAVEESSDDDFDFDDDFDDDFDFDDL